MKHSARAGARQAKAAGGQPKAAGGQPKAAAGQPKAAAGQPTAMASAAQRGRRRLLVQVPYCIVLAGLVAGLTTIRGGGQAVRSGTLVIAGALLAGSLIRLVLPDGRAGMLASRRRLADVGALAALGIGLLVAGLFARVSS